MSAFIYSNPSLFKNSSQPKITPSALRARNHLHRRVMSDLFIPQAQPSVNPKLAKTNLQLQSTSNPTQKPLLTSKLDRFKTARTEKSAPSSLTAQMAIILHSNLLSPTELTEILRYKHIYFLAKEEIKRPLSYTSNEGDYQVITGDHICYRYEILSLINFGSFGKVLKCMDHKTGELVAIKVLRKVHGSKQQGLNEYKIALLMSQDTKETSSLVKIKRKLEFRFHLFMVFELLSIDLYEFLSANGSASVSISLTKRITVQLLKGLSYMHSLNIIHCDLKPENILFKHSNKSVVKIIDFGSACYTDSKLFSYIQSRFYRAPEIALQCGYDQSIDIWSLGCIVVELLTGVPLFPANNEVELIYMIVEVLGMPPKALLSRAKARLKIDFDSMRPGIRTLDRVLQKYSAEVVGFVNKCLKWMPSQRTTAKEGLKDGWIQGKINK